MPPPAPYEARAIPQIKPKNPNKHVSLARLGLTHNRWLSRHV